LVAGAAAQIVGEVLQRRPKPDPATLVGEGKVIEIAAVSESAILKREFSGDFVYVAVSGPASLLRRYRQYRRTRK
jgi:GTP-binding GTPase N-terminal